MTAFSAGTVGLLQAAGWSPDRCVDTTSMTDELVKAGFRVFPAQAIILASFGGITIVDCNPGPGYPQRLTMDVLEVLKRIDPDYSRRLSLNGAFDTGEDWSIIGQLSDRPPEPKYMTDDDRLLLVSESGIAYTVGAGTVRVVGTSPEDAIERICEEFPPYRTY